MQVKIREIEINVFCEECNSNCYATLYEPYRRNLLKVFKPLIKEGWVFVQDKKWVDDPKAWMRNPADPKYRDRKPFFGLIGFCCKDCFEDWIKEEAEEDWIICSKNDLLEYSFEDIPHEIEVTRA